MCIICKRTNGERWEEGANAADEFLHKFQSARRTMKDAAEAMLKVSKIATSAEDRARYDIIHKKMVRLSREWSRIEHERECKDASHIRKTNPNI